MSVNWDCCHCHWITSYQSTKQRCDACSHLFCEHCEFLTTYRRNETASGVRRRDIEDEEDCCDDFGMGGFEKAADWFDQKSSEDELHDFGLR